MAAAHSTLGACAAEARQRWARLLIAETGGAAAAAAATGAPDAGGAEDSGAGGGGGGGGGGDGAMLSAAGRWMRVSGVSPTGVNELCGGGAAVGAAVGGGGVDGSGVAVAASKLGWEAVKLEGSAASETSVPLPCAPTAAIPRRLFALVSKMRSSGAAALHPASTQALAGQARAEFAAWLAPSVGAVVEGTSAGLAGATQHDATVVTQLLFDLLYTRAALGDVDSPTPTAPLPPSQEPSLQALQHALTKASQRADPIAHAVTYRPLAAAAHRAAESLSTALYPLALHASCAAVPPPARASRSLLLATPASSARAHGQGRGATLMTLPPPCGRFSYLPVQTPSLHSRAALRATAPTSSDAATPAAHASAEAEAASAGMSADASGSSSLMSRMMGSGLPSGLQSGMQGGLFANQIGRLNERLADVASVQKGQMKGVLSAGLAALGGDAGLLSKGLTGLTGGAAFSGVRSTPGTAMSTPMPPPATPGTASRTLPPATPVSAAGPPPTPSTQQP